MIDINWNKPRREITDNLILGIIKEKKFIPSIKWLSREVDKSYGLVYKSVERLKNEGKIIVKEYFDPDSKSVKKGIFSDEKALSDFFSEHISKSDKVEIPIFFLKLYELFNLLIYGDEKIIGKFAKKNNLELRNVGMFILDLITNVMKEDLDDLEKWQIEAEKYIKKVNS